MTLFHLAKLIKLCEPSVLYNVLRLNNSSNLRGYIHQPRFNLSHFQNNFCYQGPKNWNILCSSSACNNAIIMAPSMNCLKSRLRQLFLKSQSYGNEIEWIPQNKYLEMYLTAVNHDPYSSNSQSEDPLPVNYKPIYTFYCTDNLNRHISICIVQRKYFR